MCALYSFKKEILGIVYVDIWLLFKIVKDVRIFRLEATLLFRTCNKVLNLPMKDRKRKT
jgi:hypothetical protein